MRLFKSKKEEAVLLPEHKFDYINLADFHSNSSLTSFAYVSIFIGILISLAGYAADTYTAINLLAFNRWSSKLQPAIEFHISKWIFAGCIILSFVLLAFEWIIAIRIMRGNGVADIYLNSIAQRWACVFGGRGRTEDTGWKRFLVFARLTKSKRGVDYVALFTYFSFKGWIRTIFAEGPRQVINGLTLYSVMEADLIPQKVAKGDELNAIITFFKNFGILARQDQAQAVILGAMCFTLIIWVFAMLQLFIAGALYVIYLCHAIGSEEGLRGYCKVRVDEKLGDIVAHNHRKELARQQKAAETGKPGSKSAAAVPGMLNRQPTVPIVLGDDGEVSVVSITEKKQVPVSVKPMDANRNRVPTLPNISMLEKPTPAASIPSNQSRPHGPRRVGTNDSRMNLLSDQASMGYGGRGLERDASGRDGSIYTQVSSMNGSDPYGNVESPSTAGRPASTMSRQSRGLPMGQGYANHMRNGSGVTGPYGPLQQRQPQQQQYGYHGRQGSEGDYHRSDYNDNSYNNNFNYINNGSQYDNSYGYHSTYDDNRMYSPLAAPASAYNRPGAIDSNFPMIPKLQQYQPPLPQPRDIRTPANNYPNYPQQMYTSDPRSAYPVPTPGSGISSGQVPTSAYPPPSSSIHTSNASATTSALSRGPSTGSRRSDDKSSLHSQGRQIFLNDFDFERERKSEANGGQGVGLIFGEVIEMEAVSGVEKRNEAGRAPVLNVTNGDGDSVGNDKSEEGSDSEDETKSQQLAETSMFGGPKFDRMSVESEKSTAIATTTQQYGAYKPPESSMRARNLTPSASSTPLSPPRQLKRAATLGPEVEITQGSRPRDYSGSKDTPRRVGTAPLPNSASSGEEGEAGNVEYYDYFGVGKTPARAGTAPPVVDPSTRGFVGGSEKVGRDVSGFEFGFEESGESERRASSDSREQEREQPPTRKIRRSETAPVQTMQSLEGYARREREREKRYPPPALSQQWRQQGPVRPLQSRPQQHQPQYRRYRDGDEDGMDVV